MITTCAVSDSRVALDTIVARPNVERFAGYFLAQVNETKRRTLVSILIVTESHCGRDKLKNSLVYCSNLKLQACRRVSTLGLPRKQGADQRRPTVRALFRTNRNPTRARRPQKE